MKEQVHSITDEALAAIAKAGSLAELNQIRVNVLGKKGTLTGVLRSLGSLAPEERPIMGELVNKARTQLEAALEDKGRQLAEEEQQRKLAAERLDVELPGRRPRRGHIHPLRAVAEEICEVFLGMGFSIAEGPEVELDYYNFEALNLPPEHPAREMQDSLYINEKVLLRTHTSPVQVRTMEAQYPKPIRIIAPGRVYRRDALDATHSPMFHQIEGLVVDENISFGDLKGVLTIFAQKIFGEDRKVRFRPSYFPFTEPSAEVDVSCGCGGKGCRICKGTGWLEILGAGSVNPKVLAMSKYDPAKYTGFAFGMGIERIAILKYGITDIRLFYENDIRFLRQF
ncbi:MAG TPA: phenylalanine--tRNA ligase subunit alpha [Firmicutes bacterium]|jgi:phenylalanyl-tRNA synthetase alpha chain|nr:phenylalanine--tRNA ligase subunit alpha [Bacillota bacterium]HOQ24575.1 phenylalanine--tRNA ligase subunit alpha [Bacillota bacterium]HPT67841.1 phenylalanine--tRNA ligase subunit alpha [Bacillota bacterium]